MILEQFNWVKCPEKFMKTIFPKQFWEFEKYEGTPLSTRKFTTFLPPFGNTERQRVSFTLQNDEDRYRERGREKPNYFCVSQLNSRRETNV